MEELDLIDETKTLDGSIEIDGESFEIQEFVPSVEEYRELVSGLYKSFYDEDMRLAIERAMEEKSQEMRASLDAEMQKREQEIAEITRAEMLGKISKRLLRPVENGMMAQRRAPSRDVSKMTKEERAQAAKRAASGLVINFK